MLEYLQNFCTVRNSLRSAIEGDLKNTYVLECLRALGIVGKVLTGPWMHQLYGNPEGLSNLQVTPMLIAVFKRRQEETQIHKVESVVRQLSTQASQESVTTEQIAELLPGLNPDPVVADMINNPRVIVGRRVTHICYPDADSDTPIVYNGYIEKLKKNKKPTFVVSYWEDHETYDEGSDENVTLQTIAADSLLDELKFLA